MAKRPESSPQLQRLDEAAVLLERQGLLSSAASMREARDTIAAQQALLTEAYAFTKGFSGPKVGKLNRKLMALLGAPPVTAR